MRYIQVQLYQKGTERKEKKEERKKERMEGRKEGRIETIDIAIT